MAVTMLVAVLMTATLLLNTFVTYSLVPSGLTAIPLGPDPTGNVAVKLFVAVSITETLPEVPGPLLSTRYANGAAPAILIDIKIIAADTNIIEYNFCLLIMYFIRQRSIKYENQFINKNSYQYIVKKDYKKVSGDIEANV
jgi:hypothetical protein